MAWAYISPQVGGQNFFHENLHRCFHRHFLFKGKVQFGGVQYLLYHHTKFIHHKELDPWAVCHVGTQDEIGMLSENVNALYQSLLTTIDNLQEENARVSEAEAAKVDFLRAASH